MSMGFLLPNTGGANDADTPVVWRGMMVMKAVQQLLFEVDWTAGANQDLDVLVIDTPPGTGDISLSLGQLVIVDGVCDLPECSVMLTDAPRRARRVDASRRRHPRHTKGHRDFPQAGHPCA